MQWYCTGDVFFFLVFRGCGCCSNIDCCYCRSFGGFAVLVGKKSGNDSIFSGLWLLVTHECHISLYYGGFHTTRSTTERCNLRIILNLPNKFSFFFQSFLHCLHSRNNCTKRLAYAKNA